MITGISVTIIAAIIATQSRMSSRVPIFVLGIGIGIIIGGWTV